MTYLIQEYLSSVIKDLSQDGKQEDAINQFYSIMLLNCYNQINYFQAEDVINSNKLAF